MTKPLYLLIIVLTAFSLSGCQSKSTLLSNKPKTIIRSEKLTKTQQQHQFNMICDQVMKPISAAAYGAQSSELTLDAKQGKQKLAYIQLVLKNNLSQPDANQRLLAYIDKANNVLDSLIQNNGKTYQENITVFSNQTTAIARQDYNGAVPPSMVNYAKNHQ